VPDYAVLFARSARKELENLPVLAGRKILSTIERLKTNPRPSGVRKLKGVENLWRLRVGEYRVVYAVDDTHNLIDIQVIRHRKDVYR